MKIKNHILLAFCLAISCSVYASTNVDDCNNGPQYGYGKLFYNGTTHTRKEVYPLRMQHKYDTTNPVKAKNIDQQNLSHSQPLEIIINGNILDNKIIINISTKNRGKETIIIPHKNIALNGNLSNPIFSVVSECVRLDYIGQIVNFGSTYQCPDDYVTIKSGDIYNATVSLGNYYHFLPGNHTYEISIPETPFSFKDNSGHDESPVKSNTIRLTIKVPSNN